MVSKLAGDWCGLLFFIWLQEKQTLHCRSGDAGKRDKILACYLCCVKFQVGDIVLILHSNEEGEVIDIINDKMVMVDVKGVKFPAYNDQLEYPYFKKFSEKPLFPKKKE